ncbi:MAG TPA: flagellar hook-basal body complex protein FliE [Chromatiaceae bacterium]|nr:flagellar hook-basal body complex protein FliE [Chromatiaceae bacterium]
MSVEISQVLAQMRVVQAQMGGQSRVAETQEAGGFSDLLKQSIDSVNGLQQDAGQLKTDFQTGARDVDLSEVMLATQKADVAFQAMTEVRNKLVEAYKDIMNMPL